MRRVLASSVPALIILLGASLSARAQQSGWVDPPDKSAPPQSDVKPDKARPESDVSQKPAPARATEKAAERAAEKPTERTTDKATETAPSRTRRAGVAGPHDAARTDGGGDANAKVRRSADWSRSAQRLAVDYLATVSGPSAAMVGATPRFYADPVVFYGRRMGRSALMAEKRRFTRRWPDRLYRPQGPVHTACSQTEATCVVRMLFDYRAANPSRGASARGVSELVLTVSFADERPVIVAETSRVLRRGNPVLSAVDTAGHGT